MANDVGASHDVGAKPVWVAQEEETDEQPSWSTATEKDLKERGILMSTDGPHNNVLKIKPPMVITLADIDMVLRGLDDVLSEVSCLG